MVDRERLNTELKRMRQLIEQDPKVKARFDADGNGVIDGDEWEQVRQLVMRKLEAEEELAAEQEQERARGQATTDPQELTPAADVIHNVMGAVRSVADAVYASSVDPTAEPMPADGRVSDLRQIILEEVPGTTSAGFEGRTYRMVTTEGQVAGEITEQDAESGVRHLFSTTTLIVRAGSETCELDLKRGQIQVKLPRGGEAKVKKKFGFLRPKIGIEAGPRSYVAKWVDTTTLEILDDDGTPIGELERGYSGLGRFTLGDINRLRVSWRRRVPPHMWWAGVAAIILVDVDGDSGKSEDAWGRDKY